MENKRTSVYIYYSRREGGGEAKVIRVASPLSPRVLRRTVSARKERILLRNYVLRIPVKCFRSSPWRKHKIARRQLVTYPRSSLKLVSPRHTRSHTFRATSGPRNFPPPLGTTDRRECIRNVSFIPHICSAIVRTSRVHLSRVKPRRERRGDLCARARIITKKSGVHRPDKQT